MIATLPSISYQFLRALLFSLRATANEINACAGGRSSSSGSDAKWRAVLSDPDAKITEEAIGIAKKAVQAGELIPTLVKYAIASPGLLSSNSLRALTNDAKKEAVIKQFLDVGIAKLVPILKDTKELAPPMRFLVNFLTSERTVVPFLEAGGIDPVLSFIFHSKETDFQRLGASVLNNLTLTLPEEHLDTLAHSKEWKIIGGLFAVDEEAVLTFALSVSNVLCKTSKNREYFLEFAALSFAKLTQKSQLLRSSDKLCVSVLKFIARVCEGGKRVSPLVRADGVFQLVSRSLSSTNGDLCANALAALANMAAHEKAMSPLQKPVIQSAALPMLVKSCNSSHDIIRLRAVWSLANLLIHPAIQLAASEIDAVELLVSLATDPKCRSDVRLKAYTGLFHLSLRLDVMKGKLVQSGAFKQLSYISKLEPEHAALVLKALVNCSLADDASSLFSKHKLLPDVVKLLSGDAAVASFALFALENLCFSGSSADLVHDAGGLTALISAALASEGSSQLKALQLLAKLAFSSKARDSFVANPEMATKLKTVALNSKVPQATRDAASLAVQNLSLVAASSTNGDAAKSADDEEFDEFLEMEFEDDGDLIEAPPTVMPMKILVSPRRRSSTRTGSSSSKHGRDRSSSSSRTLNSDSPKSHKSGGSRDRSPSSEPRKTSSDSPKPVPASDAIKRGSARREPPPVPPRLPRDETMIQDMALTKDQYTIADAPVRVTSNKKISLASILAKIRRKDHSKSGEFVISRNSSPVITPASPSKPLPPPSTDPAKLARAKQLFKRTRVAQELLQTEGNYVRDLSILIRKWMNPLFALSKSSVSAEDVRKIFSSVETIFSVNTLLLEGLNSKMVRFPALFMQLC